MASTCMLTWVSLAVAALILLQLGSPAEGGSDSLAYVKKIVADHRLVIFSKSYCPYCRRAKSVFEAMKETPFVIELDERDDGDEIQQALAKFIGRRTVPQVFINGEHIGGSDDTVAAEQSGKLKKLLNASSASKEQSFESELCTGRGAADELSAAKLAAEKDAAGKDGAEQQKVPFSYSRIWPPVIGAAILMSMFLAWVAAKPLVVHRIKARMTKRPGRPPLKRNFSTPNVETSSKV